jgi:hypothetical protein
VSGNAKQNYTGTSPLVRDKYKPMNPTTFQIICAGQDGDFGMLLSSSGAATIDADAKSFPSGLNYNQADKDNITNFSNGNGGNYRLLSGSPYANAGSDGKDLGADISAIQAAIAGVY